jgi:hypothetical protein
MKPRDPFPWQKEAQERDARRLRRRGWFVTLGEIGLTVLVGALLFLFLYACAFHSLP